MPPSLSCACVCVCVRVCVCVDGPSPDCTITRACPPASHPDPSAAGRRAMASSRAWKPLPALSFRREREREREGGREREKEKEREGEREEGVERKEMGSRGCACQEACALVGVRVGACEGVP